jgi:hypothetical protein
MILNTPLAVWIGILTFISLFTTASLGLAVHKFNKNVFKYHKFFAFTTVTLAIMHVVLDILWLYFGITI